MLKSILTLGLMSALAAPALADRGGRYDGGGYRGGPRTSVGLSFGFSNFGYGGGSFFGVNVGRGYGYGGGYYGGYRSYAPLCRPPVIVERPVYVAPPPVVYASPPPVYYGPSPAYYAPRVYAPAPVYSPPPVYVAPPAYVAPPVYAPPPAYYYNGYGSGRYYYGR